MIFLAAIYLYGVLLPPPECDYEPTVPYTIKELALKDIPRACLRDPNDHSIWACTFLSTNVIILPKVDSIVTIERQAALLRHEKGHVNCDNWHD